MVFCVTIRCLAIAWDGEKWSLQQGECLQEQYKDVEQGSSKAIFDMPDDDGWGR